MLLFLSLIETEEDREFCEALYNRYRSELFLMARSYLKDRFDTEDVVQIVFCEVAAKHIGKLKALDEAGRERFLLLIAKYRALNCKKQKTRLVSLDESNAGEGFAFRELTDEDFVDELCRRSDRQQLRDAISKLEPADKAALWLRFGLEFSSAEIADALGEKQQTVIKRLQRSKKRLASRLAWEGGA